MIQQAQDDKMLDQNDSHPAINVGLFKKIRITAYKHNQTNHDE